MREAVERQVRDDGDGWCIRVSFSPGQFFALALETSWQRARAAAWLSVEVDTVHQITPDPSPKATALIDLLSTAP